jgi:hypothetical protein
MDTALEDVAMLVSRRDWSLAALEQVDLCLLAALDASRRRDSAERSRLRRVQKRIVYLGAWVRSLSDVERRAWAEDCARACALGDAELRARDMAEADRAATHPAQPRGALITEVATPSRS